MRIKKNQYREIGVFYRIFWWSSSGSFLFSKKGKKFYGKESEKCNYDFEQKTYGRVYN